LSLLRGSSTETRSHHGKARRGGPSHDVCFPARRVADYGRSLSLPIALHSAPRLRPQITVFSGSMMPVLMVSMTPLMVLLIALTAVMTGANWFCRVVTAPCRVRIFAASLSWAALRIVMSEASCASEVLRAAIAAAA